MKTLDLSNIVLDIRKLLATKETFLHMQESYKEALAAIVNGLGVLDTDATAFAGVVNAGSGSNYNISAGSIYYNGEIFAIDALVGTVGGGQVPVLVLDTTWRAGDPVLYSDGQSFDTHSIRKLKWFFGTSGSGIKDYSQLVRLSSYITADLTAINAAISTIQGQITTIQGQITTIQGQITTLTTNLSNEITNRTNADNTLQTNINTEITNRTNADTNLQNQINSILTSSFTNITAASGWTNSPVQGLTFGYLKEPNKRVSFRGVLNKGSLTGTAFTVISAADVPSAIVPGPSFFECPIKVIDGTGQDLPAVLAYDLSFTGDWIVRLDSSVAGATLNVNFNSVFFFTS